MMMQILNISTLTNKKPVDQDGHMIDSILRYASRFILFSLFLWGIPAAGLSQDYPDEFFNSEKQTIKSGVLNEERTLFV